MVMERTSSNEELRKSLDFYAKYEPGEILGDGISSVVRKCVCKETQETFAVKIIDKYCQKGQDIKGIDIVTQTYTEVQVLSKLKGHPGIIDLVDFYDSSAFMFLVFELAKGGELFDYLTREVTLQENTTRIMMWQLLHSVFHMHKHNFVHRDLKPENILLDEKANILLSDFGFAKEIMEDEQLYDILGTPAYFAPETLKCVVYDSSVGYGKPVDMWACGVILYTLLAGQGPFWHLKDTIMYRKIMEGKYSFANPEWDDISDLPKDLIRKLLVVDSGRRMTADEALNHQWFKGFSACDKCRKMQGFPPNRRRKIKFKILVLTIISLKKLYYTFHERYVPMTFKAVISEPYVFKEMRKLIDSVAFSMYGHWVKKTQDQIQNRGALFENTIKQEIMSMDVVDGQRKIPAATYSYELTHAFLPRRASYTRRSLNTIDKQVFGEHRTESTNNVFVANRFEK